MNSNPIQVNAIHDSFSREYAYEVIVRIVIPEEEAPYLDQNKMKELIVTKFEEQNVAENLRRKLDEF